MIYEITVINGYSNNNIPSIIFKIQNQQENFTLQLRHLRPKECGRYARASEAGRKSWQWNVKEFLPFKPLPPNLSPPERNPCPDNIKISYREISCEIRLYSPFFDWFGTKGINTIWFRFDLIRFRKNVSVCSVTQTTYKTGQFTLQPFSSLFSYNSFPSFMHPTWFSFCTFSGFLANLYPVVCFHRTTTTALLFKFVVPMNIPMNR